MARLAIDLNVIEANARAVVEACRPLHIEVWGVTKCVLGCPRVARAMLQGGVAGLADSRLANLDRLRRAVGEVPRMLLRLPYPAEAPRVVELAGISLNSERVTLDALARAAGERGREHGVILMVDMGDRREGVLPEDLMELARVAASAAPLRLAGIGANFACYGGVVPTPANLEALVELAARVRQETGGGPVGVSGGNSTSLRLVATAAMPAGISQLRVGEAILLGREPSSGEPVPGTRPDAFRLEVEVIEVKRKPSAPCGEVARDAFGRRPVHRDQGDRMRVLAAVGVQDLGMGALRPLTGGVEVLGASSDHLILDVTDVDVIPAVGDRLSFRPDYGAVLALMTSPHVDRHYG